jgi:outer membrane protease
MKNIAVFTVLVIIIGALTANNSASCQDLERESNYSFSFGTQYGFVHGLALEVVYPVPGDTKGELLSELRWDMKGVFYYGVKLDFFRTDIMSSPGFFTSVSFKTGIPGDSGILENRDWMSVENGELTNFSSHTNMTRDFYWLDLTLGATVPIRSYFYLKPFISGSWMHFSFTGRDGYGIYAREKSYNSHTYYPIDDKPDELSFPGDVIHYKQDWLLIAVGFSAGTKILSPFSFDLSFQISPFTYCAAKDEHLEREVIFMDFTGWGLFLEPAGVLSFSVERIDFSLEFAWRYIGKTRGETYYTKDNDGSYYRATNGAGAGLSLFNANFLIRIRI